jgi:DNA-binding NarL/FixJ family response regulator
MLCDLLSEHLSRRADVEATGTTGSLESARAAAALSRLDVVILDHALSRDGEYLSEHGPRLPTVILCASCVEEGRWNRGPLRRKRLAVGACRTPEALVEAVRALHHGKRAPVFPERHDDCLPEAFRRDSGLTKAELVVLSQIAGGLTNRAVADRLGVSVRTVENHRQRLRQKLGARGKGDLVHKASEIGVVSALFSSSHQAPPKMSRKNE